MTMKDPEDDMKSFMKMELNKKDRKGVKVPPDCITGKVPLLTGDHACLLGIGDAAIRIKQMRSTQQRYQMIEIDQNGNHLEGTLMVPDEPSFATLINSEMLKNIIAAMAKYSSLLYLKITASGKLTVNGWIDQQPAGALIGPLAPYDDDGVSYEPWKYQMYEKEKEARK